MQKYLAGDQSLFAIEYGFCEDYYATEIAMYVHGENILAFRRNGIYRTTRWDLDELTLWLREFLDHLEEDPFPYDCEGEFAAQKDDAAREFDSDDPDILYAYYDHLDKWEVRHRWHRQSSGAILADVFFQLVGESVEVSWDNRGLDEDVVFLSESGGARIPRDLFCETVDTFLNAYEAHWKDKIKYR